MEVRNPKILAVDDTEDNLITLRAVLWDTMPEARLLTARSGPEGLALARAEDPDVILLDILMPGMDGHEVCERLKADEKTGAIPVIFLTAARADRDSRVRALEVGGEGFLSKPPDEIELVAQIRAMTRVKAARRIQEHEQEKLAGLVAERTRDLQRELAKSAAAEESVRASLHEKEVLLSEVHHRVKNNLQVITSLLRLEASRSPEPMAQQVLRDMQRRIMSMALLHETLYKSGDFGRVDLDQYLRPLAAQLFRAAGAERVELRIDLEPLPASLDQAIPCGLILNELLSNCMKHAFRDGETGQVRVTLARESDGRVRLAVRDTGPGLPADFSERRRASLGLQLVEDLARQLGGGLEFANGPGAAVTVAFALTPMPPKGLETARFA